MKTSTALILAATTAALAACNPPDPNRTTQAPPGVNKPTAVTQPLVTPSAPLAPAERGPVAASGNTVAPGTNAAAALANESNTVAGAPPRGPADPLTQATAVNAQEAAAKAPDTAAADAAKAEVKSEGTQGPGAQRMPGTAEDTSANSPRHGALTTREESIQMPKAGQANNHSSTALEADSGRAPKQ